MTSTNTDVEHHNPSDEIEGDEEEVDLQPGHCARFILHSSHREVMLEVSCVERAHDVGDPAVARSNLKHLRKSVRSSIGRKAGDSEERHGEGPELILQVLITPEENHCHDLLHVTSRMPCNLTNGVEGGEEKEDAEGVGDGDDGRGERVDDDSKGLHLLEFSL